MDATERIDQTLAHLQSECESMLGIDPDDDTALELLWEVQRQRFINIYSDPMPRLEV